MSAPSAARAATTKYRIRGAQGVGLAAERLGNPGPRPPVLLLHGGGQTRHSWRGTAEALANRGHEAWTVDLRGHGESDWATDGDYSTAAMVDDLHAVCAEIGNPPVLVGASLGGIVGLLSEGAARPGGLRALVLVDVATQMEDAGVTRIVSFMSSAPEGFANLAEAAAAIAAYRPDRPAPTNFDGLKKNLRVGEDGRWRWHWDPAFLSAKIRGGRHDPGALADAARGLRLPTMLVRGRASDVVSLDSVATFRTQCPSATFVDIADAGHMVVGDRNDAFTTAIAEFIDGLDDAPPKEIAS